MPRTLSLSTGDGIKTPKVVAQIELPDSGQSIVISGTVQAPGQAIQSLDASSPLTAPSIPGSGSIFWQIQVDWTTGTASIIQSTTAYPPVQNKGPANPMLLVGQLLPAQQNSGPPGGVSGLGGNVSTSVIIFQMTLTASSPTAYSQNTTGQTVNQN